MPVTLDRVIIIGAGIGGLCAGIALQRLGLPVDIYEQAPAFGEVGAGLTLWSNAIKTLRKLGISEDSLRGAQVGRSELMDWRGRVFSRMPVNQMARELGAPVIAVHRADLHRVLLAALPNDVVHSGAVFTHFNQGPEDVTACFADGSTARGSLLIGADGIHSVVRQQLFPQVRLRYAGYAAWRGVVDYPDPTVHQSTSESWGRGARFGIVPIGRGRIYWFATANLPQGQSLTPPERKEALRSRFKGWHAPIEALIEATPDASILYNDISDFPPQSHWSQGRVTLLGDAAHPTTPNLGQGACQAVESSLVLARCLAEENNLAAAMQRYERERMPRTTWVTNTSWRLGQVGQIDSAPLCALRDFFMRLTPPSVARNQIIKAAGYEV